MKRKMKSSNIPKEAISPYKNYCDGYGMAGATGNGYVSVLNL